MLRASKPTNPSSTDNSPYLSRSNFGLPRRNVHNLTLTTYADYIPEQETENPLPEPPRYLDFTPGGGAAAD